MANNNTNSANPNKPAKKKDNKFVAFFKRIGTGCKGTCGDISITDKVTSVTAKKGDHATFTIGKSRDDYICGTVKIGGKTYYDGTSFKNDGDSYLAANPFIYQP